MGSLRGSLAKYLTAIGVEWTVPVIMSVRGPQWVGESGGGEAPFPTGASGLESPAAAWTTGAFCGIQEEPGTAALRSAMEVLCMR